VRGSGDEQVPPIFYSRGKTLQGLQEVSGHDFSRAESAAKLIWALQAAEKLIV
jgi:hypothetical protein